MRRLMMFLCVIVVWVSFDVPEVLACTGGGGFTMPTLEVLVTADIIVRATVDEYNGGNAMLAVDSYLKGSGNGLILLYEQSPILHTNHRQRDYYFGCGPYVSTPREGTEAYFGLNRNSDGSYSLDVIGYHKYILPIQVSSSQQTVTYGFYEGIPHERYNYDLMTHITVTLNEFEETIASILGQEATYPTGGTEFGYARPRYRPLYITTKSGQHYMMPVDATTPEPIESIPRACVDPCVATSHDGGHIVYRDPNVSERFIVWYQQLDVDAFELNAHGEYHMSSIYRAELNYPTFYADDFIFSPDGNYLLVWYDNVLTLFGFNINPVIGVNCCGILMTIDELWTTDVMTDDSVAYEDLENHVAWSGDNSTFAFWDARGLHWFNLTTMTEPLLIQERNLTYLEPSQQQTQPLPALSEHTVLELSETGRYVRYGTNQQWHLLDALTGTLRENALVTSDEALIVNVIDREENDDTNGEVALERQTINCELPLSRCVGDLALPLGNIVEIRASNRSFFVITCHEDTFSNCYAATYYWDAWYSGYDVWRLWTIVGAENVEIYEIDDLYGHLAWAIGNYSIYVPSHAPPGSGRGSLDHEHVLDSPIVALEWGEPLWYVEP